MAKPANKTRPTAIDPAAFVASVADPVRRADAEELLALMRRITGEVPRMWGPTIVGFGSYHYVYDSGREGDSPIVGFSPRRAEQVIYIVPGFDDAAALLATLGKCRTGKSCLYVKRLTDVNMDVLTEIVRRSVETVRARYPASAIADSVTSAPSRMRASSKASVARALKPGRPARARRSREGDA